MFFSNESVVFFGFRHFGRRFCGRCSYEFMSFFETELFFSMRVLFFLASGILEDGSVAFFHMNLYAILEQNCFFNGSVCFFGFMHFGKRFCRFFSYEFIIFLEQNCFFNECLFFWLQAFWKTVLWPFFHMNSSVLWNRIVFLMRVLVFFGFRHFGRRFCGLFS